MGSGPWQPLRLDTALGRLSEAPTPALCVADALAPAGLRRPPLPRLSAAPNRAASAPLAMPLLDLRRILRAEEARFASTATTGCTAPQLGTLPEGQSNRATRDAYLRRPEIAALQQHRAWPLGSKHLQPISVVPEQHTKVERDLVVVEFENFGDLATNLPLCGAFPPALLALTAAGGCVCFFWGLAPALSEINKGRHELRRLRSEQRHLRRKYRDVLQSMQVRCTSAAEALDEARELQNLRMRLGGNARALRSEKVQRMVAAPLAAAGSALTGAGVFLFPGLVTPASSAGYASNLLTGAVGNVPVAAWAIANLIWSLVTLRRALADGRLVRRYPLNKVWQRQVDIARVVRQRLAAVQTQACLRAVAMAGITTGSLLTVTTLWGYVVLGPATLLGIYANYHDRTKVAYSRRLFLGETNVQSGRALLNDIGYATRSCDVIRAHKHVARGRYPFGVDAPLPFNVLCRLWRWTRRYTFDKRTPPPPPLELLRAFFGAYRPVQMQWLRQKEAILQRDVLALMRANSTCPSALLQRKQAALQRSMQSLAQEHSALGRDLDALRARRSLRPDRGPTEGWVFRVLGFVVEHGLWGEFAAALAADACLRRPIWPLPRCGTFAVLDANLYHLALVEAGSTYLADPRYMSAFFELAEPIMLRFGKLHFQGLQRELVDLLRARLRHKHDRHSVAAAMWAVRDSSPSA